MKKTLWMLLLLACGAVVYAQGAGQAVKDKPAAGKKAAPAQAAPEAAAPASAGSAAPAARKTARAETSKQAAARQAEQDAEESVVMIDSKSDAEATGRFSGAAFGEEQEEPAVPGGMPSSYGQLKGVVNEGGRTLLVLESQEDGAITFVQVTAGKNSVAWKFIGRIPRGMD